jgi:membrane-associated phospholipid phosphatase
MFFRKEKSWQIKTAYIISRIFEPFLWLSIFMLLILFSHYFAGYHRLGWAIGMVLFFGFLPLFFIWSGIRRGGISDIDITKKEERTPFILAILFFWGIGLILAWFMGAPILIIKILIIALIIGIIILFINFYWKISGHTLALTAVFLMINELFGWQYFWLLLFIPLIAWSRWAQKKHTLEQLVAGVLLGMVAWVLFRIF